MVSERENKTQGRRPRRWPLVVLNLALMVVVALVLGWLALRWLKVFTNHGDEVAVPDVKGMTVSSADVKLRSEGFGVQVIDSVYNLQMPRGVVVEQNPGQGNVVKPGRMVYLTINAMSPKMVTLPRLDNISLRQAYATLQGLGIKDISERRVISEYKDLVMGVTYRGRRLSAGARVPVNAKIVIEVGEGMPEITMDSLDMEQVRAHDADAERLDLF